MFALIKRAARAVVGGTTAPLAGHAEEGHTAAAQCSDDEEEKLAPVQPPVHALAHAPRAPAASSHVGPPVGEGRNQPSRRPHSAAKAPALDTPLLALLAGRWQARLEVQTSSDHPNAFPAAPPPSVPTERVLLHSPPGGLQIACAHKAGASASPLSGKDGESVGEVPGSGTPPAVAATHLPADDTLIGRSDADLAAAALPADDIRRLRASGLSNEAIWRLLVEEDQWQQVPANHADDSGSSSLSASRRAMEQLRCLESCVDAGRRSAVEDARGRDVVLVLGKTGCGKSTLINALNGCRMKKRDVEGMGAFVIDALAEEEEVSPPHEEHMETRVVECQERDEQEHAASPSDLSPGACPTKPRVHPVRVSKLAYRNITWRPRG